MGNSRIVTFSWPSSLLSPNARTHWAAKAKIAKAYRRECYFLTLASPLTPWEFEGGIALQLVFHPPMNRQYDDDNLVARFKAGRDGMAEAMGVNDFRFQLQPPRIGKIIQGGRVVAILAPILVVIPIMKYIGED